MVYIHIKGFKKSRSKEAYSTLLNLMSHKTMITESILFLPDKVILNLGHSVCFIVSEICGDILVTMSGGSIGI